MHQQDECLNQAMFLASESYSGSGYDALHAMFVICDDLQGFVETNDTAPTFVLAA